MKQGYSLSPFKYKTKQRTNIREYVVLMERKTRKKLMRKRTIHGKKLENVCLKNNE